MASRQHPLVVNQGTTAEVAAGRGPSDHGHLPRELSSFGGQTIDDPHAAPVLVVAGEEVLQSSEVLLQEKDNKKFLSC